LDFLLTDYVLLGLAAVLAGLVDAVVGGGGLIQLPALFSVFPQSLPATLFGTNKLAAVWGTAVAARTYAKRLSLDWSIALPAAIAALAFAFLGARSVSEFPPDILRKVLPFVLLAVAVYVFRRKDFGTEPREDVPISMSAARKRGLALAIGSVIGFYDGFFGPGTGSFLIFLFVRVFYLDFLQASAVAKVVNVACNLAALAWFGAAGYVIWQLGLMMAVCNIAGALIGTRLAMWGGTGFVRKLFLVVVGLLIIKTGVNAF
jgi:uncharacterized membrane protein YfcA